jgi:hypothetical protein
MIEIQDNDNNNVLPDPMSDVFTASFWSNPKYRPHLLSYINGVRLNAGLSPVVQTKVMNPFIPKPNENTRQYDT